MIYVDHNATSPLTPAVKKAMSEALEMTLANPNSPHRMGQESRASVEESRETIAKALGCDIGEIIFTASASEANFLALMGLWFARRKENSSRSTIYVSPMEHSSVYENLNFMAECLDAKIEKIPLTSKGSLDLAAFKKTLEKSKSDVALVTAMGAHNETGIVQPWEKLAEICGKFQIPFHTDLLQCLGRRPFSLKAPGLSTASFGFHKIGGPKGVGVLVVRTGVAFTPVLRGGAQEKKRRAGTENILGIVGAAAAVREIETLRKSYENHVQPLRNKLEKLILDMCPNAKVVGKDEGLDRLPNTSFVVLSNARSDAVLMHLDVNGVCASSGSACASGMVLPSKALLALGYPESDATCAVRFSLAPSNTEAEIQNVAKLIREGVSRICPERAIVGK